MSKTHKVNFFSLFLFIAFLNSGDSFARPTSGGDIDIRLRRVEVRVAHNSYERMVESVGINLEDVYDVKLLWNKEYSTITGSDHKVSCPEKYRRYYDVCIRNTNDGRGHDILVGVRFYKPHGGWYSPYASMVESVGIDPEDVSAIRLILKKGFTTMKGGNRQVSCPENYKEHYDICVQNTNDGRGNYLLVAVRFYEDALLWNSPYASMVDNVGINLRDVYKIKVLWAKKHSNMKGGDRQVSCPKKYRRDYDVCIRNTNDGRGHDLLVGVVFSNEDNRCNCENGADRVWHHHETCPRHRH